jgi:hypothetical protein
MKFLHVSLSALFLTLALSVDVSFAQDASNTSAPNTPVAPQPAQPQAQESNPPGAVTQAPAEAEETEQPGLFAGADLYYGGSNLAGFRRFHDGFWAAGSGLAYPSHLYLRYNGQSGAGAKVAVALSQLYNGSTGFDQPVEAWWKQPVKGKGGAKSGALTLGKFYVPFALQEWEYETKWGALYEGEWKATTLGAALVYNRNLDKANGYARLGCNLRKNINVGVSLGFGDGLTYDSVHDKALGIDLTASSGDWEALAEYMAARGNSTQRFRFGWARLNYNGWERLKPFIARYDYKDTSGTFGRYRSYAAGAGYALRSDLTLEGGYAIATGKNIWYAQIHWTPERKIK